MKKIISLISILCLLTSFAFAVPTIDGNMSETEYVNIAVGNGLGTWGMNVDNIYYYPDTGSDVLYIGIEGNLDTGSNNAIGIWLGFSEYDSGVTPGADALGGTAGAGHYMGDTGNNLYHSDFQVDYMFAINTGGGATNVYFDGVKFTNSGGNPVGSVSYMGSCDQVGTSAIGPGAAGIFSQNAVTYACNNDNAAKHGFEMSIPFSEIGDGVTVSGTMEAFAMVVSSSAYFSQDCAPGNPPSGDPGFNVDYATLGGGPYHSSAATLPVTLSAFTATFVDNQALIQWTTATETNVQGFNIYRNTEHNFNSAQKINVDLISAHGTCSTPHDYEFVDINPIYVGSTYYYWLESVDFSSTSEVYNAIAFEPEDGQGGYDNTFAEDKLSCFPNPANNNIQIDYAIKGRPTSSPVTVTIYNILGKVVRTKQINSSQNNIDISSLDAGVYFYQIKEAGFNQIKKMVVVR